MARDEHGRSLSIVHEAFFQISFVFNELVRAGLIHVSYW